TLYFLKLGLKVLQFEVQIDRGRSCCAASQRWRRTKHDFVRSQVPRLRRRPPGRQKYRVRPHLLPCLLDGFLDRTGKIGFDLHRGCVLHGVAHPTHPSDFTLTSGGTSLCESTETSGNAVSSSCLTK